MTSRLSWGWGIVFALSAFCFLLNVDTDFRPVEISLDLSHMKNESHLAGDWNIVPSKTFRGIMDAQVVGDTARISFELPSPDIFWFRIKTFFLVSDQAIRFKINQKSYPEIVSLYPNRAQKLAFRVPASDLQAGPNEISFGISQALPVVIEKLDIRNYRSRLENLPVFVGFDHAVSRSAWGGWQGKLLWLPLVWAALFFVHQIFKKLWFFLLKDELRRWGPYVWRAAYIVPHFAFLGIIMASWVTSYRIMMKPEVYFLLWGVLVLFLQAAVGLLLVPMMVWKLFWDHPQVIQEVMRLGEIPLRLSTKLWLIVLITLRSLPHLPLAASRAIGYLLERPGLLCAACIAAFLASTCVALLQGIYYALAVRVPADIVNIHGSYPWSRVLSEGIADTFGLFCLVCLVISKTLYLRGRAR